MKRLLAIDLGLRTGFAVYREDGLLERYWSRHYANRAALKRHALTVLREVDGLSWVMVEGGGPLGTIWEKAATHEALALMSLPAETWRERLLLPRQQTNGPDAKRHADTLARRVITWAGAPKPTSLRDDAAEAILVGLWGCLEIGWLDQLPRELST